MWIRCGHPLIILLLLISSGASAREERRINTLGQRIDDQMEGFRRGKPMNAGEIENYAYRMGDRKMSAAELKTVRNMIAKSNCQWSNQSEGNDGQPFVNRVASSPACKGKNGAKTVYMCYGRVACDDGQGNSELTLGLKFYVHTTCFSRTETCPEPQKCALQSSFDYANQSNGEQTFERVIIWGYESDK